MDYNSAIIYYRPSLFGNRAVIKVTEFYYESNAANHAAIINDYASCKNNAQVLLVGLTYEACAKAE